MIQRKAWTPYWVSSSVAYRDERMRDEALIEIKSLTGYFRAKKRCTHPASIQTELVSHQEHILDSSSQALNGHGYLIGLPFLIRIVIEIFQIEAGDDNGRSPQDALV